MNRNSRSRSFGIALSSQLLLSVSVVCAALVAVGTSPLHADEEADHEALRQLKSVYERAVAEDQLTLLGDHLHPDFQGVMITADPVTGMEGLSAYWTKIKSLLGEGGSYTCTLEPERSVVLGDLALARGASADKVVNAGGTVYEFTSQWTAVLQKLDGQWKLLRVQGSMDPVANPFVKSIASTAATSSGGLGALVGLVVGFLVRGLFGRRRRTAAS